MFRNKWTRLAALPIAVLANMLVVQAISSLNLTAAERGPELAAALDLASIEEPELLEAQEVAPEEPEPEPDVSRLELDMPPPSLDFDTEDFEDPLLDLQLPSIEPAAASVVVRQQGAVAANVHEAGRRASAGLALRSDAVDAPPRELASNRQPRYPRSALRRGEQGLVKVDLLIDEEGKVTEVKLVEGQAPFTDAVLEVVGRWRFTPPRNQGQPLSVWGLKTFRFDLPTR